GSSRLWHLLLKIQSLVGGGGEVRQTTTKRNTLKKMVCQRNSSFDVQKVQPKNKSA
ncbi:hypothetical protein MKW94_006936, partial [Papaver nudicaule]|nr:hypothetical protein [Papaver nudicaule]